MVGWFGKAATVAARKFLLATSAPRRSTSPKESCEV